MTSHHQEDCQGSATGPQCPKAVSQVQKWPRLGLRKIAQPTRVKLNITGSASQLSHPESYVSCGSAERSGPKR